MEVKKNNTDVTIGIVIIIFSVLMMLPTRDMPDGAELFPRIILTCFIILGCLNIIAGLKKGKVIRNQKNNIKNILITITAVLAYVLMIQFIGFFVSTVLFIVGFLYCFGQKKKSVIIFCIIGVCLFVYLLFIMQLNLTLPKGLLF